MARDFKPRHEGPRDDLCAAMHPLEAKKALCAEVAGTRTERRNRGELEVKLMFIDVKKAHINARSGIELSSGPQSRTTMRRRRHVVGQRSTADYVGELVSVQRSSGSQIGQISVAVSRTALQQRSQSGSGDSSVRRRGRWFCRRWRSNASLPVEA